MTMRKFIKRNFLYLLLLALIVVIVLTVTITALIRHSAVADQPVSPEAFVGPIQMEEFDGPVVHIFFHPLMAYPELALDGDYQAQGFDDYFVTVPEFEKIIQSLYDNQFALVRLEDVMEVVDGKVQKKPVYMPKGKKPLVISIDDANYYTYMRENGVVHKLIIDGENCLATYSIDPAGYEVISRQNEVMPAIDEFVRQHPDFSVGGAKGVVGLTGYEGILGYRTQADSPNRAEEIEAVKPIIQKLKDEGWTFASHSYGHYGASSISYEKLKSDTYKWKDEVESLIGPTSLYIYPYGETVPVGSDKMKMMVEAGFRLFAGVGGDEYYLYTDAALITQRRHIDGIALRQQRQLNLDLYDADLVIDPIRFQ